MPLAAWVHDLDPVIVRIPGTPLSLNWYGLMYVLGFVSAYLLLRLYRKRDRSPLAPQQLDLVFFALFVGVVVGGRLGFMLLYATEEFLENPLLLIRVWEGGMASHGGFLGVAVAVLYIGWKLRVPALQVGDLLTSVAAPGLFFGRLGNFINGGLWGVPTGSDWGVIFPKAGDSLPRHPSQLYEAGLEGLVLFIYMQVRFWRGDPSRRPQGQLAGEFLVAYSVLRILGEVYREPDRGISLILGLSRGTFYSILTGFLGLALIFFVRFRNRPRTG